MKIHMNVEEVSVSIESAQPEKPIWLNSLFAKHYHLVAEHFEGNLACNEAALKSHWPHNKSFRIQFSGEGN